MDITLAGIIVIIVILIVLYFWNDISKRAYKEFMRLPPSESIFQIFWDGFLLFSAIAVTIISSNISQVVNMTTVWAGVIGFGLLAVLFTLRIVIQQKLIKKKPTDTSLNNLVTNVTKMEIAIQELTKNITTLVSIQTKMQRCGGMRRAQMRRFMRRTRR